MNNEKHKNKMNRIVLTKDSVIFGDKLIVDLSKSNMTPKQFMKELTKKYEDDNNV